MKSLIVILTLSSSIAFSQSTSQQKIKNADTTQIVEASCGQCQFGMEGKGCNLAVRINGKAYFLDGAEIDKHGDAHAKDGFCNAIRQAEVNGEVIDGRFKAKSFKLLPSSEEKKKSKELIFL